MKDKKRNVILHSGTLHLYVKLFDTNKCLSDLKTINGKKHIGSFK